MLDVGTFKAVVQNTPLVSLDLCLIFEGKILLCERSNEPLKGQWFTPGGRIYKGEGWKEALTRIAYEELGMQSDKVEEFTLMGIWDHFYKNSMFDQSISTHYVNLPHFARFEKMPLVVLDDQHVKCSWFDLDSVSSGEEFHPYMQNYAKFIKNNTVNTYD